MGDAITFEGVWNAVKDVASVMQNGESIHMPGAAFAVPTGHQPGELDWADEAEHSVGWTLTYSSFAADHGLSSGTSLRIGATWKFGGKMQGAGRFLHEARLWAILDYSGLGQNFNVTGSFGDPYLRGQTGVLGGVVEVEMTYVHLHWESIRFEVELSGDGAGHIARV